MASIESETLAGLSSVIDSLLPVPVDPARLPTLMLQPVRLVPTGLRGFVGRNPDPEGEIFGRRLEAKVRIRVKADSLDSLDSAVTAMGRALLGAERKTLLQQGLLHIGLEEVGPPTITIPDADVVAEREMTFTVLYEFLKKPEEAGDIIREIPINLSVEEDS